MALALSNFSVTGTGAVIYAQVRLTSALVRRTASSNQYNFWSGALWANNTPTNNLEESSNWTFTGLTGAPPIISRFFKVVATGDNRFAWNFDSSSGRTDLWNTTSDTTRVTLVREASGGTIQMFTLEPVPGSNGTGFLAWRTANISGSRPLTDSEWAIVDAIASGDSIIVAFHTGTAVYSSGTPPSGPMNIKYNGVDVSAAKYNGVAVTAAKYNGVEIFS